MLSSKSALLLNLLDKLWEAGSWCGETHVQKAAFFLDKHFETPTEFDFVLYRHGPYSFDLHEELASLFAHYLVEPLHTPPYGPRIRLTPSGKRYLASRQESLGDKRTSIADVAKQLGGKGVAELERLATALWFKRQEPTADAQRIAELVHKIKPHIPLAEAREAALSLS